MDSKEFLSAVVTYSKYAKYDSVLQRRENWGEIIQRNADMHAKRYPILEQEIYENYANYVMTKKVFPSMRSLQFAGKAIEVTPNRIFNCAFSAADHPAIFSEVMFNLLGGCGVGFSVQQHHVEQLPNINKPTTKRLKRYLIPDSIEGWSETIKVLMKSYFKGSSKVVFDYSDIRAKGTELVTAGGKAPGPAPLKECVDIITEKLDSIIELNGGETAKLKTLEVHDIICHISNAVLAGGIRRSALISLFSIEDEEMLTCKGNFDFTLTSQPNFDGNVYIIEGDYNGTRKEIRLGTGQYDEYIKTGKLPWWHFEEQRGRSNNSVVLEYDLVTRDMFDTIWDRVKDSGAGEPGVYWTNDRDLGSNPCFTGDTVVATADGRNGVTISELAIESNGEIKFPVYSGKSSTTSNQFGDSNKFKKWKTEIKWAVAFKTGDKPTVEVVLSDGTSFRCTDNHKLAKPNGEYVEALDSVGETLEGFFTYTPHDTKAKHRYINSFSNGYSKQHRLIWEHINGDKPSGYDIDHILNNGDDGISNLQLLSTDNHITKSGNERLGEQNGYYNTDKSLSNWIHIKGAIYSNAKRWGWSDNILEKTLEKFLKENPKPNNVNKSKIDITVKENPVVISVEYTGDVEAVYDLTVEDNHNFYIITGGDNEFSNSKGVLVHNCCEISLKSMGYCNLTSIVADGISTQEEFNERARVGAFIGTLQAGYTNFHYLRPEWQENAEDEALLGVSMTGIASGDVLKLDMVEAAKCAADENERVAKILGMNKAKRVTTVKPEGTASLVAGTSSGIHAWHAPYYIRRMRINKDEAIYDYLLKKMPAEFLEDDIFSPKTTSVLSIPVKAPADAIFRDESPIDLMERVKKVHDEWIANEYTHREGANTHNVSVTVSIDDTQWDTVGNWMWDNREHYHGISVLPLNGGTYPQMPFEDITEEQYIDLIAKFDAIENINLDDVIETNDNTDLSGEVACGGGNCELAEL